MIKLKNIRFYFSSIPEKTCSNLLVYIQHLLMLIPILYPILNITYLPMVDLPNHIAMIRLVDDILNGSYADLLKINYDPIYKTSYLILYVIYLFIKKTIVAHIYLIFIAIFYYFSILYSICFITNLDKKTLPPKILASCSSILFYNDTFFWGLISFHTSIPLYITSYLFILKWLKYEKINHAILFLVFSILAHLTHPISILFFIIILYPSIFYFAFIYKTKFKPFLLACVLPALIFCIHKILYTGTANIDPQFFQYFNLNLIIASPKMAFDMAKKFFINISNTPIRQIPEEHIIYNFSFYFALTIMFSILLYLIFFNNHKLKNINQIIGLTFLTLLIFVISCFFNGDTLPLIGMGKIWYSVRGSGFIMPFLAILFSSVAAIALNHSGLIVRSIIISVLLLITYSHSYQLKKEFTTFDRHISFIISKHLRTYNIEIIRTTQAIDENNKERYSFNTDIQASMSTNYHDSSIKYQYPLHFHLSAYLCYFGSQCINYEKLFFADPKGKNMNIFPISFK